MRSLLLAALISIGSAAAAAPIGVLGGAPADFGAGYTSRDLTGAPDPWPDGGAVAGGAVAIAPGRAVEAIFRGGDADAWSAVFGDGRAFSSASAPGDRISGLSAAAFLALFFSNEGAGAPLGAPSVALQVFGDTLEIGWDGTSSEKDHGYARIVAIVGPAAVPAPASALLLVSALAALCAAGGRRRFARDDSAPRNGRGPRPHDIVIARRGA
ncbi:hypothetical protein [Pikeienuella sp. HZG-20]|uniref:hypothetical protein n=1 Tax=Paludibacillus litoralis TaxID=3133267 RepID=UPI0030EC26FD